MADDTGFEAFWSRERERVRLALLLTLGDVQLAAEAVDEAMARAYPRWSRVGSLRDPSGWVFRVGLNWARSSLRKRRLRPTMSVDAFDRLAGDDGEFPVADAQLWAAVSRLPVSQRAVIVLRFYLDWSLDQIAEALDVPPGTVKSRLHRALKALESSQEVLR